MGFTKNQEPGRPFDLVVLDLTVSGGMGGKEALEKMLEIDPGVRAIISSGYSNDPVMADFEKYGFCGVAVKPYDFNYLIELMNSIPSKGKCI